MGDRTRFGQLSTRFLMAQISGGRRWKRVLAFSVLGIVALGGIGAAGVYALGANDVALLAKDWGEAQSCMLGAPLTPGETPSARVQKLRLATVGLDAAQKPQRGGVSWPATCTTSVAALAMHAHAAEKGRDELTAAANALAKTLSTNGETTKNVDALWKAAETAGLKAPPGASDPTTPKMPDVRFPGFGSASKLLGADVLALSLLNAEPASGAAIRVLVDEKTIPSGPVVCTAVEADTALGCTRIATELASQSPGLRLLGSSDPASAPFLFTGDRGSNGVYRGDAKPLLTGATVYGAAIATGGKARLLARRGAAKNLSVLEQASPGAPLNEVSQLSATLIDNLNDATLAYDYLVYWTGKTPSGAPASHLMARSLATSVAAVDIGEIADQPPPAAAGTAPRFTTCQSGATFAVRVRAAKTDYVTVFAGGHFGAPAAVPVAVRNGALACREGEAWVTRLSHTDGTGPDHATIDAVKCAPGACAVALHASLYDLVHGDPQALPVTKESSALVTVDGNLFILWNAGAGGVRARFAAPDKLAATPDTLVNADTDPTTGDATALDVTAFAANRFAVALVRTTTGVASIRVDASGNITLMPSAFK